MSTSEEFVDVVDEDDRVLHRATRAEMRRRNLLHRAVYVVVRNGRGDLLVHRRTTTKDVYPGYWDVTIGGVVAAGEDYVVAAHRELAEEVGIVTTALVPLFAVRYADEATRLVGRAFLAHHDGPLALQAEEVDWAGFMSLAEAERIMRHEPCCPDGILVVRRYLENQPARNS